MRSITRAKTLLRSSLKRVRHTRHVRRAEKWLRFRDVRYISIGDRIDQFKYPGWETVDTVGADHCVDVRTDPLPFDNDSVDFINCSHLIEHLPAPDASTHFLKEAHRVLKPGATLRIATPDAGLVIERYLAGDWGFFLANDGAPMLGRLRRGTVSAESFLPHNMLVRCFASYSGRLDTGGGPLVDKKEVDRRLHELTTMEFSRWCVSLLEAGRVYAHVNVYDKPTLKVDLQEAGFRRVDFVQMHESSNPLVARLKIDREVRNWFSLYADAVK